MTAAAAVLSATGGTALVPRLQLLQCLAMGRTLLGLSLTPTSSECAVLRPPYTTPLMVHSGDMLTSGALKKLAVDDHEVRRGGWSGVIRIWWVCEGPDVAVRDPSGDAFGWHASAEFGGSKKACRG